MNAIHVSPDFEAFNRRQNQNRLIPVSTEVIADLDTPLTLFSKIYQDKAQLFLFESMEGGEKWGRYSFIGFSPLAVLTSKGHEIVIQDNQLSPGTVEKFEGDPLHYLKKLVADMNAFEDPQLPRFCGGAVGYLGYDMVRFMEELPHSLEPHDLPDCSFMIPGVVLVHDNFKQTVTIIKWVDTKDCKDLAALYKKAEADLLALKRGLNSALPASFWQEPAPDEEAVSTFSSNMKPEQFYQMVEKAKAYILAGDIFQVVLSQRFHTKTKISPLSIYRALRQINPSPYLFFVKFEKLIQIGSSPEILVRKTEDTIELRPIAGTRPRGATVKEDQRLEQELLADPKERAEHLMLVDLGRNDVGRVAVGGSVEVTELLAVERYSHVMHIVSGVQGKVHPDFDQFDVLKACFPAGTVSGAPKIRAMEIIEELEPQRRGPYAGSVGYFGFSGNMDFCITIRTFTMLDDDLWIQAGAGIVADSDPHHEFEETVNKSMGLRRAVALAETRL